MEKLKLEKENFLEEGCFLDMCQAGSVKIKKESGCIVLVRENKHGDEEVCCIVRKGEVEERMSSAVRRQRVAVKNLQEKFEAERKRLEEMETFIRLAEEFLNTKDDFDWGWHKTHVPKIFHSC